MRSSSTAVRVLAFARTLRAAGMPVGPGRALAAVEAAAEVGVARRIDLYWALHAALVARAEERPLFDEAFRLFWREGGPLPDGLAELLPRAPAGESSPQAVSRRLADAVPGRRTAPPRQRDGADAVLAWSAREALRTKDFEGMSVAELREAEAAVAALQLDLREVPARRLRPDPRGDRVDVGATLRAALRSGGTPLELRRRSATTRPPALVALVDVSGSMGRYARILLRFLHALAAARPAVHAFTFATRLTPVTRHLRHRDPDHALAAVGRAVRDWDGGTRIGAALGEFNLRWSRRLLGRGAVVLLFTDGLDRDDARGLSAETERLRRSCRRLVWLNPLLRYVGFEPKASGVRAMLPHVSELRPVHDLASMEQLAAALSGPALRRGPFLAGRATAPRPRAPA